MDNPSIIYKNLKISPSIKKRLDILKGRLTYDKYFDLILGYFEMTGVDPKYNQLPPQVSIIKAIKEECNVIYKRIEDSIKIQRAIEDQHIIPIQHTIEQLLTGNVMSEKNVDISANDEEVLQLVLLSKEQAATIHNQEQAILSLKRDVIDANKSNRLEEVISTVEELLSDKLLEKDKNGYFLLSDEHRTQLIKKIKTISDV